MFFLVFLVSGKLFGSRREGQEFLKNQKTRKTIVFIRFLKSSDQKTEHCFIGFLKRHAQKHTKHNGLSGFLVADLQKDIWKQAGGGRIS